jgi:ABC-type antimicrobial peptide transport system permease subunit
MEIVGVVQDAKYNNVKDAVGPQFFLPRRQSASLGTMNFYVHSAVPAEQVLAAVPEVMARLDPNLPVNNLRTLAQQVRENVMLDRFVGTLAAAFAVLATLLAAMGLYGVLSYTVAQRNREIGLRLALGAPPSQLRGMVLRQVGWMALIGGVIGLVVAIALGQAASALLYGISATQPGVILLASAALGSVVLLAGYLPARRASRIDPMHALRNE